ncbi:sugar phosphate isomerase/epimerase family protein [Azospirillum sp. INR13]|uniref:sugar phosphate isomerase/epimerase family protein n=1 Tax=Azospirillum sp. INR13 TaxID=2596919 RepID=UPI00351C0F8D
MPPPFWPPFPLPPRWRDETVALHHQFPASSGVAGGSGRLGSRQWLSGDRAVGRACPQHGGGVRPRRRLAGAVRPVGADGQRLSAAGRRPRRAGAQDAGPLPAGAALGAGKIRTFAGSTGSAETSPERRIFIAERLRTLCGLAADHGLSLLVETHPGTLADSLTATRALIAAVGHPALKVNFDVLHVWEGGDDPVAARRALRPHIGHYHLKNIRARDDLPVFEPANVYAAAGRRDGMVPLFDGVVDYRRFLAELADDPAAEGSLEWFGDDCYTVLRRDRDDVEAALAPVAGTLPRPLPRRVAGTRHGTA